MGVHRSEWACIVTDAVLHELRDLTSLSTLWLAGCTLVTDVGVRELRDLTAITDLGLDGCTKVTNVGLQHFRPSQRSPRSTSAAPPPPRRGGTHSRLPSPPSPLPSIDQ